jgi:hypothetical protein
VAIHQLPILDGSLSFTTGGEVYVEPSSVHFTNDALPSNVIVFPDGALRSGFLGHFDVPQNYVGGAQIIAKWTCAPTTGIVVWDFDYLSVAGDDAASLDQAIQQALEISDAAPTAAFRRLTAAFTGLTAGNFAPGNTVQYGFFRDKTDATTTDTLADEALLFGLFFQYSDA